MKSQRSLRSTILIASVFIIFGVISFIPKNSDPVEKIVASLQKWTETQPQEKIYLHTDKPYYVVGDTIWFKAYVTIGSKHQLSALSGAVYVDLINEADSLAQSIKLPVTAGMAKGSFVLSDSTSRDGNYRIRAYTQWMRNAGSDYFYDKVISIGNSVTNPVFARIRYEYKKEGSKTTVIAHITYTNDNGTPYVGKKVSYDLKDGSTLIATGTKATDEKGELHVQLQSGKSGRLQNIRLVTRLEVAEKDYIVKDFAVKSVAAQADVQFFPEGGTLVNGIKTRIAFKATGTDGLGLNVKGVVTDNENKEVASFEALHLGMGYFRMVPESGKTYKAKITYPDGSESTASLPAAVNDGYIMAVYNDPATDTVLVRINASSSLYKNADQHVSLVVQGSGTVYYATDIAVTKPSASVWIPVKELPSGIVQFTLFSSAGNPLNERIIFVQNNDKMDIKVSSAKKTYAQREKVDITVDATDQKGAPLAGNFSVSVINEETVPVDETAEHTIFSHILLSSDIKGYIEKPNYYFYEPSAETKANLDILMLTQGYRRFVWKDLLSGKPFQPLFKAEKLTTEISGRLVTLGNKPVAGGKVKLINTKLAFIADTVTDANGRFKFDNLLITNEINFSIQGRTAKNGSKVEVILDKVKGQSLTPNPNIGDINTDLHKKMQALLVNSKKMDEDLQSHGRLGRTQQLKEVMIRARKPKLGPSYALAIPEGHSDQSIKVEGTENFKNLLDYLRMKLTNISFRMDNTNECGPVNAPYSRGERIGIVANGRRLSICEAQDLLENDAENVDRIEVVRTNQALISMLGGPAIVFYLKNGVSLYKNYDPSIVKYSPGGFNTVKEFYSPKYDKLTDDPIADLRSTIYWNPSVITTGGKAKFDFYNADGKGTYRVVIEGINGDGLLGRQVYRYKVE